MAIERRQAPWEDDEARQRRRPRWGEFRQAYPRIVTALALGLAGLIAVDAWVIYKRARYSREISALRASLSETERRRADGILAANADRARLQVALVRRDSALEDDLNLAVSLDDSRLFLQREGARLRDIPVLIGAAKEIGTPPNRVVLAAPRGRFVVARVVDASYRWTAPVWLFADRGLPPPAGRQFAGALGPVAILLSGGAIIYSDPPDGPLSDPRYVLPGAMRAGAGDLAAIAEALQPGMPVYFY